MKPAQISSTQETSTIWFRGLRHIHTLEPLQKGGVCLDFRMAAGYIGTVYIETERVYEAGRSACDILPNREGRNVPSSFMLLSN